MGIAPQYLPLLRTQHLCECVEQLKTEAPSCSAHLCAIGSEWDQDVLSAAMQARLQSTNKSQLLSVVQIQR